MHIIPKQNQPRRLLQQRRHLQRQRQRQRQRTPQLTVQFNSISSNIYLAMFIKSLEFVTKKEVPWKLL